MLEPLGGQPIGLQGNKKSRQGCLVAAIVAFLMIVPCGIVGGFLLFGNKYTEEYQCAMTEIKKHPEVISLLGEPLEAGFFAFGNYSSENAQKSVNFTTSLAGSKGSATLSVNSFRNPLGSSFQMSLIRDRKIVIYNGVYPCQ